MPSKKKARGKARKKAKAVATRNPCSARSDHRLSFDHFELPSGTTQADGDACNNLNQEVSLNLRNNSKATENLNATLLFALETYKKYKLLTDFRQELFRGMLLSGGTSCIILEESKQTNNLAYCATIQIVMLMAFEMLDRSNGYFGFVEYQEMIQALDNTIQCPREIVRFFHR